MSIDHIRSRISRIREFKGHVIMKYVATVLPLVEFDICPLELEHVN